MNNFQNDVINLARHVILAEATPPSLRERALDVILGIYDEASEYYRFACAATKGKEYRIPKVVKREIEFLMHRGRKVHAVKLLMLVCPDFGIIDSKNVIESALFSPTAEPVGYVYEYATFHDDGQIKINYPKN
jgi:hypothetical protein